MLVLTRRTNESIVIGPDVRVTITRVAGNRVVLAIDAPQAVKVLRGEVTPYTPPPSPKEPPRGN